MTTLIENEVFMESAMTGGRRFLFASWEGGGNLPPMMAVVRKLVGRGHTVRVIGDPCNREEFEALGASFVSWQRSPARKDKSVQTDPLRDWEIKSPPALIRRLCDHLFVGTALARAQDVLEALKSFSADAIVTSEMLFGVMAAAEAAGVPCAALAANIYMYPLPGVPPFGPGFQPARSWLGRIRDRAVRSIAFNAFGKYTGAFNEARKALGLDPLTHPFDQLEHIDRILVQTSAAFDFPAMSLPKNVNYAGPEIDDPDWVQTWQSPWTDDDKRPLVLVSFSTTFQDQSASLARVIAALGTLDVRAVVTAGPAVDIAALPSPKNVHVCQSAPHNQLLRDAAVMITHAGHGTVIRSLAAGVPLVCMPMGRDQNDNAARVVGRGAGVWISPKSSGSKIAGAVIEVLSDPDYADAARRLGNRVADDARRSSTIAILEEMASCAAVTGPLADRATGG